MKNTLPALVCCLTILFFSCKKDAAVNNGNNNNTDAVVTVKDTPVLLTHLLVRDTTITGSPDTVATYDFSYDESYRPVNFIFKQYKAGTVNYSSNMIYEYQGTDTLASRTTVTEINIFGGNSTVSHDTNYYFYQGGKLVSDSFITQDGNRFETHHYNYLADRIQADYFAVITDPPYTITGNSVFYETFSNGNLAQLTDTIIQVFPTSPTQYLVNNIAVTYLPNPDPYYRLIRPVKRVYYDEADWIWDPIPLFASPNLPSATQHDNEQWNSTGSGGSSNTCEYHYDFRPDGYPSVMYQADYETGYTAYFTTSYYYNK